MKSILYNQKAEKLKEFQLPKNIFGVSVKPELLHQVVLYYERLKREKIAKTKDRSEVRGGGRKPWRQKGTGRSRHGSRRSPIWKGGGVTFGPNTEKEYRVKINKKMAKKALFGVLSQKLKEKEILFFEKIELKDNKSKSLNNIINAFSKIKKDVKSKKIIIILEKKNENILKASRNVKNIFTIPSDSLNVYFLLKAKYILIEKEAIKNIKK
jgi:large subunit ribosomal protein L4